MTIILTDGSTESSYELFEYMDLKDTTWHPGRDLSTFRHTGFSPQPNRLYKIRAVRGEGYRVNFGRSFAYVPPGEQSREQVEKSPGDLIKLMDGLVNMIKKDGEPILILDRYNSLKLRYDDNRPYRAITDLFFKQFSDLKLEVEVRKYFDQQTEKPRTLLKPFVVKMNEDGHPELNQPLYSIGKTSPFDYQPFLNAAKLYLEKNQPGQG